MNFFGLNIEECINLMKIATIQSKLFLTLNQLTQISLTESNAQFIIVTRLFPIEKCAAYNWKADKNTLTTVCSTFFYLPQIVASQ